MPVPTAARRRQIPPPAGKSNIVQLRERMDLPVPLATRTPCQELGPDLWFSSSPTDLSLAKAYCRGCANRKSCLAGALERAEPTGVWGGEIFEQGRIIEFKRPRGRPRKTAPADDPSTHPLAQ